MTDEDININFKELANKPYFWPAVIGICFLTLTLPLLKTYKTYWWDESQYLLMVKHLFLNTPTTGWWEGRSILHSYLLYGLTLPFGYNENALAVVNLLFSLAFVISTYYLIKELLGKNHAILGGLLTAFQWLILYWGLRINIDMLNGFLLTLSALYYIRGLNNKKDNLLSGLFLGLALTIRFTGAITGIIYLIHSLITKRKLKDSTNL